jgi:hypothetical protein
MIASIDTFLDRVPTGSYNCLDFVREVWLAMTGEDVTQRLTRLTGVFRQRRATITGVRGFRRLEQPVSPCFVVMQRRGFDPHVGIYLDRRVLHLHPRGAEFQPLCVAQAYFKTIRFYQ